ncbi:hypothetical protein ACFX11_038068 [Malus domestica]
MLHFIEEDSNPTSPTHKSQQPTATTYGEPIVLEIPVVSKVISPQASPHPATITEELPVSTQDPTQV